MHLRFKGFLGTVMAGLFTFWGGSAYGGTIYSTSFATAPGSEWSTSLTGVTPIGSNPFLGEFGNQSITLDVAVLGQHSALTIEFDLYIIRSWDGIGVAGPDTWSLGVEGGPSLLTTTFSNDDGTYPGDPNSPRSQSYPGAFPVGVFPGRTGASEVNSLGFINAFVPMVQDAAYGMSFTFDHSAASARFVFSGSGLEELANESWALDNVRVSTHAVPEWATGMSGAVETLTLSALFWFRRRSERF